MKGLATLRVKICTPNKLYSDLKMLDTNIYYVPKEVTENQLQPINMNLKKYKLTQKT